MVDVENKETLHTTVMDSNIISLTWVQEQDSNRIDSKEIFYQDRCKPSLNLFSPVSVLSLLVYEQCFLFNPPLFEAMYPGLDFQENASKFLPKLPPLSRSFGVNKINNEENLEDTKRIRDQTHLNILLVGQEGGKLSLSVFGLFPCGVIDLHPFMKESGCESFGAVVDAAVSDDLKIMCIFLESDGVCKQFFPL